MDKIYTKIEKMIKESKSYEQLNVCDKIINNFEKMYNEKNMTFKLRKKLNVKKQKWVII